jgi:hypothetical protein
MKKIEIRDLCLDSSLSIQEQEQVMGGLLRRFKSEVQHLEVFQ